MGAGLALFLLAVVVRLPGLGVIVTSDEPVWAARSAQFARALLQGNLGKTYRLSHPGVTTMWSGAIGLMEVYLLQSQGEGQNLMDFLDSVSHDPPHLALFPPMRLPIVLLTALCVAGVFFLARRLFSTPVALLGAALLALDPFYLAHSRLLHHDALITSFITLSLLSLAVHLWGGGGRRYLAFSGAAAGLAFLSKLTGLFLGPFVAATLLADGLFPAEGRRPRLKEALFGLALWGLMAALTAFAFWPAMWAGPWRIFQRLAEESLSLMERGHLQFFWGRVSYDPGPLFYPVAFLLRATPLSLIGLALGFGWWAAGRGEMRQRRAIACCLAYMILFTVFVTWSRKKFDRYLLPIFPMVDLLAAWGWIGLARALSDRRKMAGPILAGLSLMQAAFALPYHPYLLSYYNPLFGGARVAAETLLVGWGEGLDRVAQYLAGKENAARLKVASPYNHCLTIFFPGEALYFRYPLLWRADYAVLYISQVQRQFPDAGIIRYFQAREPEYKVRLHGLDYASIYPVPPFRTASLPELEHPARFDFADKIRLHGYDLPDSVQAGEALHITSYWECLQPMAESYYVFAHLQDEEGHLVTQQDDLPVMGLFPTDEWEPGDFIRDEHVLSLPPFILPGRYRLHVGWYLMGRDQPLPVQDGAGNPQAGASLGFISVARPATSASPDELPLTSRLDADLTQGVRLLGSDPFPKKVRPGEPLSLSLYWQARQNLKASYEVALWLQDEAGRRWNETRQSPSYPTANWRWDDLWQDWHDLFIAADTPPGEYHLWLGLAEEEWSEILGQVELGTLTVEGRSRLFAVPPIGHPLPATLGDKVEFLGYDLAEGRIRPGQALHLTLYWRALAEMKTSYKVFTHLLDGADKLWGQKDSIPGKGQFPTTGWLPGEIIIDRYEIEVAPDAPLGEYVLEIGMYDELSGARLPVSGAKGKGQEDRILLGRVRVIK